MRLESPSDHRRTAADLPVAVESEVRGLAPGPVMLALVLAPVAPDGMVLRVYSRAGGRLDGTCPLGL